MRVIATYRGELPEEWMLHSFSFFFSFFFSGKPNVWPPAVRTQVFFSPTQAAKGQTQQWALRGRKEKKKQKTLVPLRLQSVLPFSRDCNRSPLLFMFIYRSFARILSCSQMRGETRLWSHAVNYSITRQHPALAVQGWKKKKKHNPFWLNQSGNYIVWAVSFSRQPEKWIEYDEKKKNTSKASAWVSAAPHPWPPVVSRMRVWGCGWLMMGLRNGSLLPSLLSALTLLPLRSEAAWRGGVAVFNIAGSHWGRPAVFKGFGDIFFSFFFFYLRMKIHSCVVSPCPDVKPHCGKQSLIM